MKRVWQLREAKNKPSEVVDEAIQHGPRVITKRGVEVAIVLSYPEYRKMIASRKKLSDFFRESPPWDAHLDLDRETSGLREEIVP